MNRRDFRPRGKTDICLNPSGQPQRMPSTILEAHPWQVYRGETLREGWKHSSQENPDVCVGYGTSRVGGGVGRGALRLRGSFARQPGILPPVREPGAPPSARQQHEHTPGALPVAGAGLLVLARWCFCPRDPAAFLNPASLNSSVQCGQFRWS